MRHFEREPLSALRVNRSVRNSCNGHTVSFTGKQNSPNKKPVCNLTVTGFIIIQICQWKFGLEPPKAE